MTTTNKTTAATFEPEKYCSPHSSGPRPVFVGWYTVAEAKTIRRHGETACNYADVAILPGTYPVYAYEYLRNLATKGTARLHVTIPGVVVADFYQNRLFHAISNHRNENVGRQQDAHFEFYRYEMDRHPGFAPKAGIFTDD